MTNKEAIADLETLLAYIPIYRRFYQSISMGIKALKQESKTGHWIDTHDKEEWWGEEFICSECDYRMIGDSNFCPNCGVDMRSDTE